MNPNAETSSVTQDVVSSGSSASQASAVTTEVINQSTAESNAQSSSVTIDTLNQSSVESSAQSSVVVVDVLEQVHGSRSERLFPIHLRRFR